MAKETYISKDYLKRMLTSTDPAYINSLCKQARMTRQVHCGNNIYLRGIIEYSNICRKNCFYCGIRKDNKCVKRFRLTEEEVLNQAILSYEKGFGSVVIQSGERNDREFTRTIDRLLREIKYLTNDNLGITLSCGEQTEETYRRWFESGAHRYLLRIESGNEELYRKLHPDNDLHDYKARIRALENLKKTGYQTGTGVMIGLPFQMPDHLVDDLIFFKELDVDMVGMGPYIAQRDTPLYQQTSSVPPMQERLELSIRMIAALRLLMPDINIAASTALDAIVSGSRYRALTSGANVFMPNLTPRNYVNEYNLYEGKTVLADSPDRLLEDAEKILAAHGDRIGYNQWGDSKYYFSKKLAKKEAKP